MAGLVGASNPKNEIAPRGRGEKGHVGQDDKNKYEKIEYLKTVKFREFFIKLKVHL
jgi:hypothetical protein